MPERLEIVTPSRWLYRLLGESFLGDISRRTIPNGVDLTRFCPSKKDPEPMNDVVRLAPGEKMLLAVASPFDERKGLQDALSIAAQLRGKARVVLVGLTSAQCRQMPEYVTALPRTDSTQQLVSLYQSADCLLNPTHEDTYPTVNMEAMACGTPVAGYGVGGAAEQLQCACAQAVPVGDTQDLADAAMRLAQAKSSLVSGCRTWAETHFDRRLAVQTYLSMYTKMTGA